MTLFTGMNIDLKVRGLDGLSQNIINDANCTINLFAPPKNPEQNVSDRVPDYVLTATYNSTIRYYVATISTTGWAAGTWWMQGIISGGAENYEAWNYSSFILNP